MSYDIADYNEPEESESTIAEDFADAPAAIPCPVIEDELIAGLDTLSQVSPDGNESVSAEQATIYWQLVAYLLKQKGCRLPERFSL